MKSVKILLNFLLAGMVLHGCDTARNVEDPDLHYFIKYYGGDGNQSGVDMLALDDGTFLLLGNYSGATYTDIYLLRVGAEGDVLWERRLQGETRTTIFDAKDLERSGDGNFVVLADVRADINALSHINVFKISPDGDVLDNVVFGTAANDFSRSVTALADGGYIVSGVTEFTATWNLANEPDPDLGDTYTVRLDADLQLLSTNEWSPVINGFGSNLDVAVRAVQLEPTDTSSYYVFGYTNSTINGSSNSGTLNLKERFGLFYFQQGRSGTVGGVNYPGNINPEHNTKINFVDRVPPEMGGGFVVVGTSLNNVGQGNIFLARMRPLLTFSGGWQNDATLYKLLPFERNMNISGVAATGSLTGEFGYLVLGNEVRSTGARNMHLAKVNQLGNVLWTTSFGSEAEEDYGAAVTQLPDGRIYVLGTMGLGDNQQKMALIKINRNGLFLK